MKRIKIDLDMDPEPEEASNQGVVFFLTLEEGAQSPVESLQNRVPSAASIATPKSLIYQYCDL